MTCFSFYLAPDGPAKFCVYDSVVFRLYYVYVYSIRQTARGRDTLVYDPYPRTPPVHVHRMPGAPARGRVPRVLGALVQ